jgi:hypothetical protein
LRRLDFLYLRLYHQQRLLQLAVKLDPGAGKAVSPEVDKGLRDALERLAISPDRGGQPGPLPILADSPGKGEAPEPGAKQPLPQELVSIGPPAQCTRQMQKELEQTLLKRLEEAKAAEKKKKKT